VANTNHAKIASLRILVSISLLSIRARLHIDPSLAFYGLIDTKYSSEGQSLHNAAGTRGPVNPLTSQTPNQANLLFAPQHQVCVTTCSWVGRALPRRLSGSPDGGAVPSRASGESPFFFSRPPAPFLQTLGPGRWLLQANHNGQLL
jgi:hypothetical protein